jgi:transposase-like protein
MRKARKLDVACPNKNCRAFNKIGLRNIIRKGKQRNGTKRYQCTDCKRTFARTINTPFFHKHLNKKQIIRICKLLAEKTGYRAIARVTGHHLDTIRATADAVAKHCKKFNEYFITELNLTPIEVDEMWSFVKKKKKIALLRTAKKWKLEMHTPT